MPESITTQRQCLCGAVTFSSDTADLEVGVYHCATGRGWGGVHYLRSIAAQTKSSAKQNMYLVTNLPSGQAAHFVVDAVPIYFIA